MRYCYMAVRFLNMKQVVAKQLCDLAFRFGRTVGRKASLEGN